jgi:YihY family inner membrane protein
VTERPGGPSEAGADHRERPALGLRARLGALQRRVMRDPRLAPLLAVQRAYDHSGGGMLTASLAFFALFTVVPTLLLLTSLLGFAVQDAGLRSEVISTVVEQIEPLEPVAQAIVDGLADSARTGTIIGILGLLWGAAGFYGSLEGAMLRMFPGPKARDAVSMRVRGVIAVVLVLAGMIVAVVLTLAVPVITSVLRIDLGVVSVVLAPVVACLVSALAALVVYLAVPPDRPSLRAAALPAVVAGVVIGLLTSLFSFAAPYLVSSYVALGTVVGGVFIALVWFNLVFQILLYGAAFARLRRDGERRAGPPRL